MAGAALRAAVIALGGCRLAAIKPQRELEGSAAPPTKGAGGEPAHFSRKHSKCLFIFSAASSHGGGGGGGGGGGRTAAGMRGARGRFVPCKPGAAAWSCLRHRSLSTLSLLLLHPALSIPCRRRMWPPLRPCSAWESLLAGFWVQGLVPGAKRHRGCCCARAGARRAPGWLVPARFRVPGGDLAVPGSPVGGVTAAPSHPPQQQVKRGGSGTGKPRFLVSRRHRKRAAASRHAANRSPHSSPAAPRPSWGWEAARLRHPHGTAVWAACCPCAHPFCSAVFAALAPPSCGASPLLPLSTTTVPRAVRCRRDLCR